MSKRLPPSQRPERRKSREVMSMPLPREGAKPILLTAPTIHDLRWYGREMLAALQSGWDQGLEEPCVLAIWRGGAYAKEHGLTDSSEPIAFRPISGPECTRYTGEPAYLGKAAAECLPLYTVVLAGRSMELSTVSDIGFEGLSLAWRHNRDLRHTMAADPRCGVNERTFRELERITGVGRAD